ncbi:hypothetical protein NVP1184A_22 [Vibrio phage 1.184.A._10N.286.49.A5]|nr:hypothetical protein NVP1184A_22 [Vibrio phage 1.184.A._10N.286.49.A5]
MKNKRKLVQGVGINDAEYKVNQNGKRCPFYKVWQSMIDRCYSKRIHKLYPSYSDCTVCNEWLSFSNFRKWMVTQVWELKQLDKDIIEPGNKIYCPEKCRFIDPQVNTFLTNVHKLKDNGLPVGVCFDGRMATKKYRVSIGINGKIFKLGNYKTAEEAGTAYIKAKYDHIVSVAALQADHAVRDGLIMHANILIGKKEP